MSSRAVVGTATGGIATALAGRVAVASGSGIALAELLDGEKEAVDACCDTTFDEDPDDRPVLFQLAGGRAAVLDATTGELLGTMVWRARPYGDTMACTAWNIGIKLVPAARGRGLGGAAGRLLARHLFATTELNRVEAYTEAANVAGQRGLEKAGFRFEGVARGVHLRGGKMRDLVLYSVVRADLEAAGGVRAVLGRRAGVVLAHALPGEFEEVLTASGPAFGVDPDGRRSPVTPFELMRGAVLDERTERLLGVVSWHAVDYGGTLGCTAWNIGITLLPDARGRGVGTAAQRLLAEHLFASTEVDRVEAGTDVRNLAERRALEKAGFRLDGVIRGAQLRGGRRRDLALYGMLRTDLDG